MSQTGFTPIITYNTATASAAPTAVNLTQGELAVNVTDKKLYTKDSGGAVVQVGSGPSATDILSNKTLIVPVINGFSGTGNATITGTLGITGGVAAGNGTSGGTLSADAANAQVNLKTSGVMKWQLVNEFPSAGQMTVYDAVNAVNRVVFSSTGLAVTGSVSLTTNLVLDRPGVGSTIASTDALDIGVAAGKALRVLNNNVVQATLDASGNLLVGNTSNSYSVVQASHPSNYAFGVVNSSATNPYGLYISLSGVTGGAGAELISAYDAGAIRFRVLGSGNCQNQNNSYGAISDLKLKENITDATPKLAKLMQVRVVNYNLKTDPGHKQIGVIAQELELISPGLIEETPDYIEVAKTREVEVPEVPAVDAVLDADGVEVAPAVEAIPASTRSEEYTEREATGEVTKSVKYSVFVPMLIKAMQEQQVMIESLTARLTALEAA